MAANAVRPTPSSTPPVTSRPIRPARLAHTAPTTRAAAPKASSGDQSAQIASLASFAQNQAVSELGASVLAVWKYASTKSAAPTSAIASCHRAARARTPAAADDVDGPGSRAGCAGEGRTAGSGGAPASALVGSLRHALAVVVRRARQSQVRAAAASPASAPTGEPSELLDGAGAHIARMATPSRPAARPAARPASAGGRDCARHRGRHGRRTSTCSGSGSASPRARARTRSRRARRPRCGCRSRGPPGPLFEALNDRRGEDGRLGRHPRGLSPSKAYSIARDAVRTTRP